MYKKILTVLFVCTYGCFASFDESKSYNDAIHKLAGYLVRMEELAGKTVDFNLPDEKKKSDTSCFPSFEEKLIASGSSEFEDEDQVLERVAAIENELEAEMRKLRKLNKMKHDEDKARLLMDGMSESINNKIPYINKDIETHEKNFFKEIFDIKL